ncbi:hypothetical protein RB601_006402 [Gaeumannomyces tritici]
MDDYMFETMLEGCTSVNETTSYLEILNYSDPTMNSNEEHSLPMSEFENFIHRRGVFEPPRLKNGAKLLHGLRLVLQQRAQDPETFAPNVISFTAGDYEAMVRGMRLPLRAIEGTAVVGPFFWSAMDHADDADPHLHVIFRKSDVRKKGRTRGWELMLSYSFRTGVTSGYAKGTESSDLVEAVRTVRACAHDVNHPLLLPLVVLSHDLSPNGDVKQRDARDWLRRLEHAVSMREEIHERESYVGGTCTGTGTGTGGASLSGLDLDQLNRDLVECHSQVLWKRPRAYLEIAAALEDAMELFRSRLTLIPRERGGGPLGSLDRAHRGMLARLGFYRAKLRGVESYAHTTLERLGIQRAALYNTLAQKESRLSLEIASQQRRLAHASKRDSNSMKTLSLLGAIFLPATFLASVFSMTFFDFKAQNGEPVVAESVWIYFALTVPLTLTIVVCWLVWDRRRERHYAAEDEDLEKGIDKMELQIMAAMRQRTLSKVRTFGPGNAIKSEKLRQDAKDGGVKVKEKV